MSRAAVFVWTLFWRPSRILAEPMNRAAQAITAHPFVVALVFAEGFFVGLIVGGPLR